MRSYSKSYVDYALIQAHYKDSKIQLTEKVGLENALEGEIRKQIAPRNKSGPTYIETPDLLTGDDSIIY